MIINRLEMAYDRAKHSQKQIDLPKELEEYGPRYRFMAALFFELKKIQGKNSIWLSRADARSLGNFASDDEVELCFSMLIKLGVIRKLEPPGKTKRGKKLATTYLFIYKQSRKPEPEKPEPPPEPARNIFAEIRITLLGKDESK